MMTSTVLNLAVCRTCVTYEFSLMTLLSMSSRSSVDRVPDWCWGGHGFESHRGLRFCPTLVSCWLIHLSQVLLLLRTKLNSLEVKLQRSLQVCEKDQTSGLWSCELNVYHIKVDILVKKNGSYQDLINDKLSDEKNKQTQLTTLIQDFNTVLSCKPVKTTIMEPDI